MGKEQGGKILLIDDEENMSWLFEESLGQKYRILTATTREKGLELLVKEAPNLILLDLYIGDANGLDVLKEIRQAGYTMPVLVITAFGSVETAVQAMKDGAYDYIVKPFSFEKLEKAIDQILSSGSRNSKTKREIIYQSAEMNEVLSTLDKAAATNANLLLLGESGTGKELFAREAHRCSSRSGGPFIAINCAAVPENLLESELFGYEKGAFTGAAAAKIGKLQLADGGTIFLDEIGDMPIILQGKLLRVLEQRQIEKLGGTKPVDINVRVIAATNQDLNKFMLEGRFRSDLYYRLAVIPLNIPPLRERTNDIVYLANYFLVKFSEQYGKRFQKVSAGTAEILNGYNWPGNVRELRNIMEQVVILHNGMIVEPEHLPSFLAAKSHPLAEERKWKERKSRHISNYERQEICKALNKYNGNRTKAAAFLSMSVRNLQLKIKELGIGPEDYFQNFHV
jgi:DNA-binding NtrC family response regulator